MQRKRYEVTGSVQGVGFRVWAVRHAAGLGVCGTVLNRGDGAVEVEAAGTPAQLAELEALLARGPRLAEVRQVRELEPGTGRLPEGFEIAG